MSLDCNLALHSSGYWIWFGIAGRLQDSAVKAKSVLAFQRGLMLSNCINIVP